MAQSGTSNFIEIDQQQLDGELALAAAILRRLLEDTRSRRADIRAEAHRFLEGPGVQWWDDALALGGLLLAEAQALLDRATAGGREDLKIS